MAKNNNKKPKLEISKDGKLEKLWAQCGRLYTDRKLHLIEIQKIDQQIAQIEATIIQIRKSGKEIQKDSSNGKDV